MTHFFFITLIATKTNKTLQHNYSKIITYEAENIFKKEKKARRERMNETNKEKMNEKKDTQEREQKLYNV